MKGEYGEDQRRLEAAMAHAVAGDRDTALSEVLAIAAVSADREFRLWSALAQTTLYHPQGVAGLAVFAQHTGTNVSDAPPAVGLAIRFLTAQAARDRADLELLYMTAHASGDQALLDEVLGLLLDAATESARAQQAATAARKGTFRSGPGQ